jgi:RNA polymerase sigma-B factor
MPPPERTTVTAEPSFAEFATSRDQDLRDHLIEAHLGLAHQLARRFANRGETHGDLVQVASVALIHAVDRFDPDRGFEFSTFATRTILGELKRHFRDKGWAVRAPRRIQELYLELGAATDTLTQELGHPPTVPELAARTGASEEAVLEAMEAGQAYRATSIDAPDRREGTIAARLGQTDGGFDAAEDHQVLEAALGRLPEREQRILRLRYVDGLTQSEIAEQIGVSQMHVSRLLTASIATLRESFTEA